MAVVSLTAARATGTRSWSAWIWSRRSSTDAPPSTRSSVRGRPVVRETTALGAAFLAGLAEGVWASPAEVAGLWQQDAVFSPRAPQSVVDDRHATWRRAVARSRAWA